MTSIGIDSADNPNVGDIHHVALVVADRDHTIGRLSETLGRRRTYTTGGLNPHAVFRDGGTGLDLSVGFLWLGTTLLEVIQPMDDKSPHAAFLREQGEGLHHLGFLVSSFDDQVARLTAAGCSTLVDAAGPGNVVRMVYLDGAPTGGTIIELMDRSPAFDGFWEQVYQAVGR